MKKKKESKKLGRPKTAPEGSKTRSFYLSPELVLLLQVKAAEQGRSVNQIVIRALKAAL